MAHTMYFASEVRSDQEVRADKSLVTPKETRWRNRWSAPWPGRSSPQNTAIKYRDRLEALIAAKVAGKETVSVTASAPQPGPQLTSWKPCRRVSLRSRSRSPRPKRSQSGGQ